MKTTTAHIAMLSILCVAQPTSARAQLLSFPPPPALIQKRTLDQILTIDAATTAAKTKTNEQAQSTLKYLPLSQQTEKNADAKNASNTIIDLSFDQTTGVIVTNDVSECGKNDNCFMNGKKIEFNIIKKKEPFLEPNSMIIQFNPSISQKDIDNYLEENRSNIINTFPSVGAIQIKADLKKFFVKIPEDRDANDTILRGLANAIKEYTKDSRVLSASPNTVLKKENVRRSMFESNLEAATGIISSAAHPGKTEDWGVSDIQANQLWSLPGADNGVIFGVIDGGFGQHEDLIFIGPDPSAPVADHGTHVAGIACGMHTNGAGVRGVLPRCFVRARAAKFPYTAQDAGDQKGTVLFLFAQIIAELEDFVENSPEVKTYNISLGYNWISNADFNPDSPNAEQWRLIISAQSIPIISYLRNAEAKDKLLFSAAGNDSSGLATPIQAKYSSPFNWAAVEANKNGITSGVIVEAHTPQGKRADFSNVGGTLSCPGVNILSTIAHDDRNHVATGYYGLMSGTSMASPYCAAGMALFRLVRPKYSSKEAVTCLTRSSAKSDSGAPMLRLKEAITLCP